jgi:arginine N-succinyltransferase
MSHRVRVARRGDVDAILGLAKMTGGGFTNLPPDREALAARLERCEAALARTEESPDDELYVLVLEDADRARIVGTAQIFSAVGRQWPFYSYKITSLTQTSRELGRSFSAQMLNLVTDFQGSSEVGGLFLHPDARSGGLGKLLARSRYLFIAAHRRRFAARTIAELRGWLDVHGNSPFWDGLGGRFFGMAYQEADRMNALMGNQFIADLMPKHPIYTAMLPDDARRVIGVPHDNGRPAMQMLEHEGFRFDNYVDIFDGGPTMAAATDEIRTVREATAARLAGIGVEDGEPLLVASGRLAQFRAAFAQARRPGEGEVELDSAAAALLDIKIGDVLVHARR